ncbi:MAG: hypothetical protein LBR90_03560 [Elusimicrobiota bacterium]|jgi:hypothetical protein|nr:hypothetical protein [Elusimicrobiota bacterium]
MFTIDQALRAVEYGQNYFEGPALLEIRRWLHCLGEYRAHMEKRHLSAVSARAVVTYAAMLEGALPSIAARRRQLISKEKDNIYAMLAQVIDAALKDWAW